MQPNQKVKSVKGWKVKKADDTVRCSLVEEPIIFIEKIPERKIELLMDEYRSTEWLGYMVGKQVDENFFVEDLIIPPHKDASATQAEAEPFYVPEECIGFIHSHHTMGAFHSSTDDGHVDRNFPFSITVAIDKSSIAYDAVAHRTTACGKMALTKAKVKVINPQPLFDEDMFIEEAKKQINKSKKPLMYRKDLYDKLTNHKASKCTVPAEDLGNYGKTPTHVNMGGIIMGYDEYINYCGE